jgi:hypothetical protein
MINPMAQLMTGLDNARAADEVFWGELGPCDHVLNIYEDESAFLDSLHDFLWAGFQNNESVVVIATQEHLAGLDDRIRASGVDPGAALASQRYFAIDADEALSNFMVRDWPDSLLFHSYVGNLLMQARQRRSQVRAFGEMVALLWERGHQAATVRLECLWNQFCREEFFNLYCAYPKTGFSTDAQTSLDEICRNHSHVITS